MLATYKIDISSMLLLVTILVLQIIMCFSPAPSAWGVVFISDLRGLVLLVDVFAMPVQKTKKTKKNW